jgi:hypothetical protein
MNCIIKNQETLPKGSWNMECSYMVKPLPLTYTITSTGQHYIRFCFVFEIKISSKELNWKRLRKLKAFLLEYDTGPGAVIVITVLPYKYFLSYSYIYTYVFVVRGEWYRYLWNLKRDTHILYMLNCIGYNLKDFHNQHNCNSENN